METHSQDSHLSESNPAFSYAKSGSMTIIDLLNAAGQLTLAQQPFQVIGLYRLWLQHTRSPIAYAAWFNLGVTLSNVGDPAAAEQAYLTALGLKPDFVEAHLNLGNLQEAKGQPEQALATWRKVLDIVDISVENDRPFYIQALNNLGRLLEIYKHNAEAQDMLLCSLKLNPKQPKVITHWVHLRQKQCDWPIYSSVEGISHEEMVNATSALAMLSASDDPAEQLASSQRFVDQNILKNVQPMSSKRSYGHQRLRIGYLSSDFGSHAVSILIAELLELHDRQKVEVYGFCWTKEDGTPLRARMVSAMDHHIRINTLDDQQAAKCIREHEIDILIDLHGLTSGMRANILSYRPAPLQMTYLGFPGSTALPEIDYVLCDRFVLPPDLAIFFTEKPLYLSNTFQVNDRKRVIGPRLNRADCGLPVDNFIFCSFNNNYKFTSDMFACWMRILFRVPNSILWLVADSDQVKENLSIQAEHHGVQRSRLYFADRVGPDAYLARYQVADLFLDTLPFNAGTTASDALWAGLPLLTSVGHTFAARMAGSLLQAVDLPELITYNLQDYEDKAVELANSPERIVAMKQHLVDIHLSCALFDSPRFVQDLENIFKQKIDELPPALIKTSYLSANLDYIECPNAPSNFNVQQNVVDRRYVIVAPPFQHNSAGIRVLYELQKWLVRAGLDAIVCTWFQGYPVDQFSDDIVIYPEVAPGNILNAKHVVRYIMNVPGKLGHGEHKYADNEILIAYNKDLSCYTDGAILQVPSIEPFFNDTNTVKNKNAVYIGKGKDLGRHPDNCILITKTYPPTRRDLALLLRSVNTLYIYDDFSMIVMEAKLCGCVVKLIKSNGEIFEYPYVFIPTLNQFKDQLHEFIEMTKRL